MLDRNGGIQGTPCFNGLKHVVIPILGLLANLVIMIFYLVGPFTVAGMSWKEPYIALGVVALWGIYGAVYFMKSSKAKGKEMLSQQTCEILKRLDCVLVSASRMVTLRGGHPVLHSMSFNFHKINGKVL